MSDFLAFCRHLFSYLSFLRGIFVALVMLLLLCAVGLAWTEEMPFGDALYLTLITGLTIGYGDFVPLTGLGRVVAVAAGLVGLVVIGLTVAVANRALATAAQEKRKGGAQDPD